MSILKNKIDFVAFVSVTMANANGDPLNGNRPRIDYNGYGEISDVCIKRKIRNRMQDLGYDIFVKSADRCDDGYGSLSERAKGQLKEEKDPEEYARKACEKWLDVRSFGQLFAFSSDKKNKKGDNEKGSGVSIGIRGPVSVHQAVSVLPVEIESMQITKSVNGDPSENMSSDRMGYKHFVRFGIYKIKGTINVQLAEKTGFSEKDADIIKECIRSLFVNDSSSARPDGSMEVVRLYWFRHSSKDGQFSSAKVHRSVRIIPKDPNKIPKDVSDFEIEVDELPGLVPEVIEGM